ncbi:MAG: hypothetical protein HYX44_08700, partial [Aquabacterium sp.]|nr:hypothetical protein [Aquabacterium sp.]
MPARFVRQGRWLALAVVALAGAGWLHSRADGGKSKPVMVAAAEPLSSAAKAALSVQVVRPQTGQWAMSLTAIGASAAWRQRHSR